jgi:4-nitrophenyl phosphatase
MTMQKTLQPIKSLILDMDGVLWRADQPIGDLPRIFSEIERSGYRVALATNNSTLSVKLYLEKLKGFGVDLQPWQIVTSSQAAAQHLHKLFPKGGPVYVIGEVGLIEALEQQNFYIDEQNAQAVVVGWDRQLVFNKLVIAFRLINAGRPFIGTNPDRTYPTPEGLVPGTGSIIIALEASTQIQPFIVGKPLPYMYEIALERLNNPPENTLVVGDRLETDIVGAQSIGCQSALVLSGVTSEEAGYAWEPKLDFIAPDLQSLITMIGS